jgi:hypothetical protein
MDEKTLLPPASPKQKKKSGSLNSEDRPRRVSSLKPRGTVLSKIGPIALTVVLTLMTGLIALAIVLILTGLSYAADSEVTASQERSSKITLSCSGTLKDNDGYEIREKPIPSLSLVIDQDQRVVRGFRGGLSIGEFPIVNSTESSISLQTVADNGDSVVGSVDRYSGFATLTAMRNQKINWSYELTCKPAKPLF